MYGGGLVIELVIESLELKSLGTELVYDGTIVNNLGIKSIVLGILGTYLGLNPIF